jgi:hypothetical protein
MHCAFISLPLRVSFTTMEERDFSRAREELVRREGQVHGAVLEMLRKFDEKKPESTTDACVSPTQGPVFPTARRREGFDRSGSQRRRNRRMGKFVEDLPKEKEDSETESEEDDKADWRLSRIGPKIISYEPAPWEEEITEKALPPEPKAAPMARENSQGLTIITEEEEKESPTTLFTLPVASKPLLTPPPDAPRQSSSSYFTVYKLPPDIFPASQTPRSPLSPTSPVSELSVPRSPLKSTSPSTLRSRAGLKKIFLSTWRPKRKEDVEPLSPSPSISSTATSLPTPTIQITSPFNPRRGDGSPIYPDDLETKGFKLPELRLSRADWSEWGRQVSERL